MLKFLTIAGIAAATLLAAAPADQAEAGSRYNSPYYATGKAQPWATGNSARRYQAPNYGRAPAPTKIGGYRIRPYSRARASTYLTGKHGAPAKGPVAIRAISES